MAQPAPDLTPREAVLCGVAYADIFDFPVRCGELPFYVPMLAMTDEEMQATVEVLVREGALGRAGVYLFLPGRDALVGQRTQAEARVRAHMALVHAHLGTLLAQPWIKAAFLTGSLAAGNPAARSDADLLLILDRRVMWLGYGLVRLWCRRRREIEFCPNYALSEAALALAFPNLFTAVELGRAIPLKGLALAQTLADRNAWSGDFLPNVPSMRTRAIRVMPRPSLSGRLLSLAVRSPLGRLANRLERWRLQWRTRGRYQPKEGVYKPHPPRRQIAILQSLRTRLDRLGLRALPVRAHIDAELGPLEKAERLWQPGASEAVAETAAALGEP